MVHLAQQSAGIPSTTIFTPTTSELYRLTINIDCSVHNGNYGDWIYDLSWTSDLALVRGNCGASTSSGQVIPFRGRIGTPVVYNVEEGIPLPNFTYDLDIVIEQLK